MYTGQSDWVWVKKVHSSSSSSSSTAGQEIFVMKFWGELNFCHRTKIDILIMHRKIVHILFFITAHDGQNNYTAQRS